MKPLVRRLLFTVVVLCAFLKPSLAQNTLDNLGLTSARPAAATYSLRKMSTSYAGPLVRILIGTNFYDVYPDASTGFFATTSLISAAQSTYNAAVASAGSSTLSSLITAGTTTATVAVWYDQSGYANNAVQATTANQPRIIYQGNIETLNGKPTLRFVGSSAQYFESVNNVSISGASSVNAVAKNLTAAANSASIVTTKAVLAKDGLSAANASTSAYQIKQDFPSSTDGVYWIDLPTVGVKQVYCIMNSSYDGGGWMLAMKATTGTTFSYSSTHWTTTTTLNTTDLTRNNADAKYDAMNYFQTKDMMAIWPDISNSGSESGSIDNLSNWNWLQNNFHNSGSRTTLISKFSSAQTSIYTSTNGTMTFNGYGASAFSNQGGFTFYGINYTANSGASVRWGFAWNNETDQSSNDVSGGIGMGSSFGSYSAGDKISCCQGNTGINRSARVEIYIR